MVYISFKKLLKKRDRNIVKFIFCDVMACLFGVYNFKTLNSLRVVLKYPTSIKIFVQSKNKVRIFWGWEPSNNKNTEPHQIFSGSYNEKCIFPKYQWKRASENSNPAFRVTNGHLWIH